MTGLLDIFGTSGTGSLGLLGMSPEDIQRTRDDAQAQALYALAGQLLQGGQSTGASIAKGMQMGQQAYRTAMQNELQDKLGTFQLQEVMRKRKLEEESLKRKELAQKLLMEGYVPAQKAVAEQPAMFYGEQTAMPVRDDEGNLMPGATPAVAGSIATPAKYDISKVGPIIMSGVAGTEGIEELSKRLNLQKAMAGETFKLGEGEKQYQRDPFTGETREVAAGGPKPEQIAGDVREAMQVLGIIKPINELTLTDRDLIKKYIDRKELLKAPKVAVDLKDPTAVAKAQADVVKDWRGVVKDTGAMEVADRFKAARVAVQQGNAGNKAADGALIYAIGKIYDPSGAVQEGDKKTILGNRNIPDTLKAYAERVFNTGSDLLPSERNNLLKVAENIVQQKAANLEAQKAPYTSISKQLGGTGDLLLNPLADILKPQADMGDLASQARAELARRRKGQ